MSYKEQILTKRISYEVNTSPIEDHITVTKIYQAFKVLQILIQHSVTIRTKHKIILDLLLFWRFYLPKTNDKVKSLLVLKNTSGDEAR